MENHGKQALWGFSISRNRPFYLKLQYLWSGQQAVTTGCDNRLWQQVSICPGGRYPTNSTCRSFTANLRYCPKYRKNQKKKPTWLTWQTKLNREIALNQPFCHKKNTSNWRLTCWGFARLRDQSNCSWLSRIGSERPWKPLWKSHIDLYISLQESTIVNLGILQDYKINQLSINPHMIVGWSWMVMDGQCTNTHPRFPSW